MLHPHRYNPFVQGYHGDEATTEIGRETEKLKAAQGLLNFVNRSNEDWTVTAQNVAFSDDILEFTYNDHIGQQDGDIEPVLEMVERASDYRMQEDEPVTVIGDSWDNMEIASGQEVYDAAMDMDTRLTKDLAYETMAG